MVDKLRYLLFYLIDAGNYWIELLGVLETQAEILISTLPIEAKISEYISYFKKELKIYKQFNQFSKELTPEIIIQSQKEIVKFITTRNLSEDMIPQLYLSIVALIIAIILGLFTDIELSDEVLDTADKLYLAGLFSIYFLNRIIDRLKRIIYLKRINQSATK